jgi:hypothetical protein
MKQWITEKYWEWKYSRQYDAADSIYAWWWAFRCWIKYHPRLIDCAARCGNKLWANKNQDKYQPQFCSESCAYYGVDAFEKAANDEIPF